MDAKDKLRELYRSHWPALCDALRPIVNNPEYSVKPTGPLLLWPYHDDTEYENAEVRVMIFGQETNGWSGIFNPDAPAAEEVSRIQQDIYDDFYNEEALHYRSAFWNGFRLFTRMLNAAYPNKNIKYAWNNIIKIGKDHAKNRPPQYIYDVEMSCFNVVQDEIDILKPQILIFLTGPNYDKNIIDKFPNARMSPLDDNIMNLDIPNVDFAFRTYHPQFTYFQGKGFTETLYEKIIENIKL